MFPFFLLRNFVWSIAKTLIHDDVTSAIQDLGRLDFKNFKEQISVENTCLPFILSPDTWQKIKLKLPPLKQ